MKQNKFTLVIIFLILFLILVTAAQGQAYSSKKKNDFSEARWTSQVENSTVKALYAPHYNGKQFFVPWLPMAGKSFLDVLGWKLFTKTDYTNKERAFLPQLLPDTAARLQQTKGNFILWIGRKYPDIDYAFMAITAYHPRWFMHQQHMNIAEAVKGFKELGARFFIPTQWGTFYLGSEPPGFPGLDLTRHLKKHQLAPGRFKIMAIGEILPLAPKER